MLVADLEHLPRPSYQPLPHDDDRQTGEEHAEGLEHIRPDDRLDASERSVEYTDTEGDEDGQVDIEAGNLGQGKAGGVDYYGEVEVGQDDVADSGEHTDGLVKPPLKVGVSRAVLQSRQGEQM